MLSDEDFAALVEKARAGEQDAATEMVRLYEPEIRRAARLRLTDPEMRRVVDSIDIAQSVFGRFFRTAESVDVQRPEQLLALLTTMTRNRIIDEHRRQTAQKRGGDNGQSGIALADVGDDTPGPKTATIAKDLAQIARSRLSPDELNLADRRNAGESWDEIARQLNESPEALRKRLDRALARVRDEMDDDAAASKKNS
ncbi:MAG: sigma-70 family RNA polymerase sigma factor [Fuerstiella sp.]